MKKYHGEQFNTVSKLADFLNENQNYTLVSFAKEIKIHAIFEVVEVENIKPEVEVKKEVEVKEKKKVTRRKKASKK